ncbi:hypothetical protein ACFPT7_00575 [Acidicapsa dinghuensis]|uniref:Uncharacterized protein n=1 Tax=Acidicapsa dinghuensis TaxID=2218256 RepID=A0ABW1E8Y6_9BACT|nr:hypothetical protein [Acidicapsa dinghuensis]
MHCCDTKLKPPRGLWRSAGSCVSSGVLLVLLPKCPMCIAAYLAVWAGASVAMPVAAHLRMAAEIVFAASLLFVAVRWMALRTRRIA